MLEKLATHPLRTKHGDFMVHGFRCPDTAEVVLALESSLGSKKGNWTVRIQFDCLYGNVFGSINCDCSQQMEFAMKRIQASQPGLLIYFPSRDCRGLGLPMKLILSEAEHELNLPPYEVSQAFGIKHGAYEQLTCVATILKRLGVKRPIKLMTNNPEKKAALLESGIKLHSVLNMPTNEDQLSSIAQRELIEKRSVLGHWGLGLDLGCAQST